MQLSLYVIENEAAIAAVPGAIRTTLAVWLSARGHGVAKKILDPTGFDKKKWFHSLRNPVLRGA